MKKIHESVGGLSFGTIRDTITYVTWEGEVTEAGIRALTEFSKGSRELVAEGEPSKALFNAEKAKGIDRGGRKGLRELGRDKPWDRVVFVGVRFEIKVMLELIVRALETMGIETAEMVFMDSEAEALAWLEHGSAAKAS